jgi:hypothetical protein
MKIMRAPELLGISRTWLRGSIDSSANASELRLSEAVVMLKQITDARRIQVTGIVASEDRVVRVEWGLSRRLEVCVSNARSHVSHRKHVRSVVPSFLLQAQMVA